MEKDIIAKNKEWFMLLYTIGDIRKKDRENLRMEKGGRL